MRMYQHILLPVFFDETNEVLLQKADNLSKLHKARLSVVSVVCNNPMQYTQLQMHSTLENAKRDLNALGRKYKIPLCDQFLCSGSFEREIFKLVMELGIDLLILNAVAQGFLRVLLEEKCDILWLGNIGISEQSLQC